MKLLPLLYRVLGRLFQRRGNMSFALFCYREAAQLNPNDAQATFAMGKVLLLNEDDTAAAEAFTRAIHLQPDFPDAHNNLGVCLEKQGRFDEAADCYRAALRMRPNYAAACNNLGNIHLSQSRLAAAETCYRDAIRIDPRYAEAHNNLAIVLNAKGHFEQAEQSCRTALRLQPQFAGASNNLGNALLNQSRLEEAVAAFRAALSLQPDLMEAHINLALLYGDNSRLAQAAPYYEKQLKQNPDSFQANNRLGVALQAQGRLDEAQKYFEEALRLNPDYVDAYASLGNNQVFQADLHPALASFRKVLALASNIGAHQSYLFYLLYLPETEPAALFAEHRQWTEKYAAPLARNIQPHANDSNPERRLRIGYVSRDFRQHSVAYFIEPILRQHDRSSVEVYCYSNVIEPDHVTERLKQVADVWRDIHLKSNAQVCDLVRTDEIDILVDLTGHTSGSRLQVFAQKPAPVQVTYLGYPDTTGLHTVDYRITDAFADPVGMTERYHTETLLRLPRSFLLYAPADNAAEVAPPPSLAQGHITFGSFNNIAKINEQVIALWSRILLSVPGSRLLLKGFSLGSEQTKRRLTDMFAQHGIEAGRVDLFNFIPDVANHLELYRKIDIALDPFPYNGTTTTCEALWMGVPVISLAGATHVARVGVSLLNNVGLSSLIANTGDDYIRIAVELASDGPRLQQLRSSLRAMVQDSPLTDTVGFTQELESAYREMWRHWCAQSTGSMINDGIVTLR